MLLQALGLYQRFARPCDNPPTHGKYILCRQRISVNHGAGVFGASGRARASVLTADLVMYRVAACCMLTTTRSKAGQALTMCLQVSATEWGRAAQDTATKVRKAKAESAGKSAHGCQAGA